MKLMFTIKGTKAEIIFCFGFFFAEFYSGRLIYFILRNTSSYFIETFDKLKKFTTYIKLQQGEEWNARFYGIELVF